MKQPVGIGRDSRDGDSDQGTELGRLAFEREPVKEAAINVRVAGRSVLDQIRASFPGDRLPLLAEGQADFQLHGYGGPYVYVLPGGLKPRNRGCRGQMVVVVRKVLKLELALAIGHGAATVMRDRVVDRDCSAGDDRSRRIQDRSVDRSAVGLSETRKRASQ